MNGKTTGRLQVTGGHTLYYQALGDPSSPPVLFIHGGPGGRCHPPDGVPENVYAIYYDQRGCGQSTPKGELSYNTTWELIEDIEALRETLKIKRWCVVGGSWGATLALLYAQSYPARVTKLILRGVWLNRKEDIDWLYGPGGASQFFPEEWEEFVRPIPVSKRGDIVRAYYDVMTGIDEKKKIECAKAYAKWEIITSRLTYDPKDEEDESLDDKVIYTTLETHYFSNMSWLSDNQIIENCYRIKDIPVVILHGRYDLQCRVCGAYDLHRALPLSTLKILDVGHLDEVFKSEIWNEVVTR